MAGKFVITTAKNGEFTFNLKASNGEVILTASETYTTMSACENGIASVKKNSSANIEDQTRSETQKHPKYELYKDKAGEYRFRLKAANGEIIGKSEGYKAKASAKKGIASIAKNAPDAPIVVIDPEAK
ncbi:MAG: YegP family protein [Clostridia bacterium]|nr:YegP family protein [Clostridia bacterium]